MKFVILAALAALADPTAAQTPYSAAPAQASAPAAAPAAPATTALQVELPLIENVTRDPTCGGRAAFVQRALCVQTTQVAISGVVEKYEQDFVRQGWAAASGRENLIVYVKRRPEGGCDAFQMLAFTDDTRAAAPTEPAWLAFAGIPGNICTNPSAPAAQ